jgi:hypothetical protein
LASLYEKINDLEESNQKYVILILTSISPLLTHSAGAEYVRFNDSSTPA